MTIGVDLGGTNIRAGIQTNGSIVQRRQATLENKDSMSDTLSQVIDNIKPLMQLGIQGIGIAVPSVVDTKNGIVYNVVNIPSWKKVELGDILQRTFAVPVKVDNDANCFTLGEHHFGLARSHASIVGLVIGTGLGSGIILDNRLYTGSNCGAGEIGYLPYLDHDFEFYCSGNFFSAVHNTSAYETNLQALGGSNVALRIWREFGVHMGNAVKSVVYAYDPEMIVIGGSVAKAFAFFEDSMRQELLRNFHFPESVKRLKIVQSCDDNITLLGAASLAKQPELM
jgi:glucokinase